MISNSLIKRVIDGMMTFDEMAEFAQILREDVRENGKKIKEGIMQTSRLDADVYTEENTFERYYSLSPIVSMIEKYKSGVVDSNYLSLWSTLYTFIIMPAVWKGSANRDLYPIEVMMYKISDYLDMMFFVDEFEEGMLDSIVKQAIKADKIYHQLKNNYNFKVVFVSEYQQLNIVFIDEQKKEYAEFEMLVEDDKVLEAEEVDGDKFAEVISELKKKQYTEI